MSKKTVYRIRDTITKKFWNGSVRRSTFSESGKTWRKKSSAESDIGYFISYKDAWKIQVPSHHNSPDHWEIVEFEIVENETSTHDTADYLQYAKLKATLDSKNRSFGWFADKMRSKGHLDKIEFMFILKPAEGKYYVDMDRIKECRAQLRQLGVKTRTFKESNGVFGMLDREQALKARMVLVVDDYVDVTAIRESLKP